VAAVIWLVQYPKIELYFFSLVETISNLGLQKSSVRQYMTTIIQPILEKGIVEYSIVHTVLLEYLTIADKVNVIF
jgi:pumilio family protein 6